MKMTKLVEKAFQNEEILNLIVGDGDYGSVPKYSPSPDKTDITLVYRGLCDYISDYPDNNYGSALQKELERLTAYKEAIEPIASLMVLEADTSKTKRLGLDLERLSESLKMGLKENWNTLKIDKTGMGKGYENGKIGNLDRLNRLFRSRSGFSFMLPAEEDLIKYSNS